MRALLPAVLLAVFAAWCGTLGGGSTAAGGLTAEIALLAVGAAVLLLHALDRLPRLSLWSWLPLAVPAAVLGLSAALSGFAAAQGGPLLPVTLWLGVPWLVAACWRGPEERRRGLAGVAAVIFVLSVWALGRWLLAGDPRPALPLGHHNLLAAWLVIGLPLAAVGLRERGLHRTLAGLACLTGLAALVATRSLAGALALAVEAAFAALWFGRYRLWLAAAALAALAFQGPRLASLTAGADPSLAARATYWRAGWEGILERPLLGWGSGSVPWTIAEHLSPRPGINPPSEVVGTLHSSPLQLAYELGLPGLALLVTAFVFFLWRALRPGGRAADPTLLVAGVASLAGGAAGGLAEAWLAVTAVPLAMAVACGAVLAAGESRAPERRALKSRMGGGLRWLPVVLAAGLLLVVLPASWRVSQARQAYEQARQASTPEEACIDLEEAARLDPRLPLYRARLAWCGEGNAELAYGAALEARGLGMLWVSAAMLAERQPADLSEEAEGMLRRALALDPLAAAAPYLLAAIDPGRSDAALCGVRALLAEPRLAAARLWQESPELVPEARRALLAWPGIDPGWREAMAALLVQAVSEDGGEAALGLGFDDLQGGASLYAFRLLPWTTEWFSVPVSASRLREITMPAAAVLRSSEAAAFPRESCAPPLPWPGRGP